jgi:hypothetical protein
MGNPDMTPNMTPREMIEIQKMADAAGLTRKVLEEYITTIEEGLEEDGIGDAQLVTTYEDTRGIVFVFRLGEYDDGSDFLAHYTVDQMRDAVKELQREERIQRRMRGR